MIHTVYQSKITDQEWHAALFQEIWNRGYVVLPEFLAPEAFQELAASARVLSNKKSDDLEGSVGALLGRSEDVMALFNGLYKIRCENEGVPYASLNPKKQTMGFPYKDARDGKRTEETPYHFDGAFVNATIAILMPPQGGELIAFPNIRRSRYAFVPRLYSRILRHVPFMRRLVPHVVARTKPNDLCLFFGDRTFHGVEPISNGERLIMTINAHW